MDRRARRFLRNARSPDDRSHLARASLLADRLIRIGPDKVATFALACALEASLRAAIAGAKRLRDLLRR